MRTTSIFFLITAAILSPSLCFADALTVKGMSCRACEKQVTSVVCKDKEMSEWFETCAARVTDANTETGEIRYTLKKGVSLDTAKMSKIEKAVVDSGRTLEKTAAAATPAKTSSN